MTLNELIQANRIIKLEQKIKKMSSLVDLATMLIEDDSYNFYHSAIEICVETASLDGEAFKGELIRLLNDIKGE